MTDELKTVLTADTKQFRREWEKATRDLEGYGKRINAVVQDTNSGVPQNLTPSVASAGLIPEELRALDQGKIRDLVKKFAKRGSAAVAVFEALNRIHEQHPLAQEFLKRPLEPEDAVDSLLTLQSGVKTKTANLDNLPDVERTIALENINEENDAASDLALALITITDQLSNMVETEPPVGPGGRSDFAIEAEKNLAAFLPAMRRLLSENTDPAVHQMARTANIPGLNDLFIPDRIEELSDEIQEINDQIADAEERLSDARSSEIQQGTASNPRGAMGLDALRGRVDALKARRADFEEELDRLERELDQLEGQSDAPRRPSDDGARRQGGAAESQAALADETDRARDALQSFVQVSGEATEAQVALGVAMPETTQEIEAQADAFYGLGQSIGALPPEIEETEERMAEIEAAGERAGDALGRAFEDLIVGGKSLDDVLKQLERDLLSILETSLFGAGGVGGFLSGALGGLFGGPAVAAAGGGLVHGPGSATSDSIPARLSDGEFVVNAAATRKNRGLLAAINAGALPAGFAEGGLAGLRLFREPQVIPRPAPPASSPVRQSAGPDQFEINMNINMHGVPGNSMGFSEDQIIARLAEAIEIAKRRHL